MSEQKYLLRTRLIVKCSNLIAVATCVTRIEVLKNTQDLLNENKIVDITSMEKVVRNKAGLNPKKRADRVLAII